MEKTKISSSESEKDLEALAAQQGVAPVINFDRLLGNFWPDDESVDEFISTVRAWRREENT